MMLPKNVLLLISEFSKPVTRPDWRHSKPIISTYKMYNMVFGDTRPIIFNLCMNIIETDWYYIYMTVHYSGLRHFQDNDIRIIIKMDGVKEALRSYNSKLNSRLNTL
jgi:hypothetical protein